MNATTDFDLESVQPVAVPTLALLLEPLVREKARENLKTSTGGATPRPLENSPKPAPINTRVEVAREARVSDNTLAKAKAISEKAPEEVKEKLRRGETSINREWNHPRR